MKSTSRKTVFDWKVILLLFCSAVIFYYILMKHDSYTNPSMELEWQLCSAGSSSWGHSCFGEPGLYNWQQALLYCSNLDLNDSTAWRLPNRNELLSLVDWETRTPASIEPFKEFTKNNVYWTSTSSHAFPDKAYYVSMFSGFTYYNYKIIQGYVRCVKGSQ